MTLKGNVCPCAYCKYFELIEYNKIIQKGFCQKHNILRELYDVLCEDFVLAKGVHTNKWYPQKRL